MVLQAPSLSARSGLRHAFFTRAGGVSQDIYATLNGGVGSRDDPDRVSENRARMARMLEVEPANFVTAYQVHSAVAVVAEAPWDAQARPKADAIVTRVPGLAIGVTTADCGPVLLADETARVIGAAHAGWRGALSGVLESTIEAMLSLGADRARIVAALGPMIRQPNYEVGGDLIDTFAAAERDSAAFFKPGARPGHSLFDLPGFIAMRLRRAGIGQIEDLGHCTYADAERFYSYRRSQHRAEPDYGRHVNAIVLAP
ncbi:MAG: peptidoglycan editing factor PgeF [Pseudorhodoplanes sp.]|nr:peptidoglycan editing factor PgeF [Pseudorhodoplanes sp.]MCL4712090.1 peptidoglycan editing factor PgeF [Pseudorhodoplanes sp.]